MVIKICDYGDCIEKTHTKYCKKHEKVVDRGKVKIKRCNKKMNNILEQTTFELELLEKVCDLFELPTAKQLITKICQELNPNKKQKDIQVELTSLIDELDSVEE